MRKLVFKAVVLIVAYNLALSVFAAAYPWLLEAPAKSALLIGLLAAMVGDVTSHLSWIAWKAHQRATRPDATEPDADEDAGSPYRSQVQSGTGNVQAGGDIYNADADGDVAIRLDNFLVVTESLRGIGLRTDKQTLTLTHRGQMFMIRYEPKS